MKKNLLFIFALAIILTIAIGFQFRSSDPGDFLAYWSSAYLFIHGGNPYDQSEMIDLQQSITNVKIDGPEALINAWNPPWLMLIFAPLGWLPFQTAHIIWTFINVFLIGLATIISWQLASKEQISKGILACFVAVFLFGVTISYLVIGQITILVLLGMLLSIWLVSKGNDHLAGAAVILTIIKPHISYLFLFVLLIWLIKNHRWKIVQGFLITVVSVLVIFSIFDPTWISDYSNLIRKLPFVTTYTSTLGSFTSSILNTKIFYLLSFLILLLAIPLIQVQERFGWLTSLNLMLLITLPFSPFGFVFDQIVLIPVIVQLIYWIWNAVYSKKTRITILVLLAFFYLIVIYMLSIHYLEYYWFFIIPILLLLIYIFAWKYQSRSLSSASIE